MIKLKTQDQIPDFMKQEGHLTGVIDGIVNGWIEGFIEGFTKEPVENLLKKLQNDMLKKDIEDTMEDTKEKIIAQITKVIFEQYSSEIESLNHQANELVLKNDNVTYSKLINTLFK